MPEPWYPFCLEEIDRKAERYPRRLRDQDRNFLATVRPRIKLGLSLTPQQEQWLRDIHSRMTELSRMKW